MLKGVVEVFTSDSRAGQRPVRSWARWAVMAAVCALVWALGSWAHASWLSFIAPPWDKIIHLCLYSGVAVGVGLLLGVRRMADLWLCFALAALAGAVDEGLQWFDATRSLDVDDLLANFVGALIGTSLHAVRWRWQMAKRAQHGDSLFTRH